MESRHLLDYNLSLFSTLKGFLINGIIVIFLFFIGLNDGLLTNLYGVFTQRTQSQLPTAKLFPIRNTRGFVLYFTMKEYTSVPYIGGISVQYK